jgi:hypothetical protein
LGDFFRVNQMRLTDRERTEYIEFRKDGWPLCPRCGEDELYSLRWMGPDPPPSLGEFIDTIEGCYSCHRKPE